MGFRFVLIKKPEQKALRNFSSQKSQELKLRKQILKSQEPDQLLASGTNLKAIKRRLPAPAIAAKTRPKSVGMVFDAKTIDENPTPMSTNGVT